MLSPLLLFHQVDTRILPGYNARMIQLAEKVDLCR